MTSLDLLFLASLATFLAMLKRGEHPRAGWEAMGLYGIQLLILAWMAGRLPVSAALSFQVLNTHLHWQMDALGWFFALLTVGTAFFCTWFAAGEWGRAQGGMRLFHASLALNVFTMLVLLSSADLLSLFIGWELVSWASYLIMTQKGGVAERAAFRYLMYAMVGAVAILMALVMVYIQVGSLDFAAFKAALPELPNGFLWAVSLLAGAGFAIKMALVPFHLWQAQAYAETPGAATAFVSAISARMGLFAFFVVVVKLITLERLTQMAIPFVPVDARELWAWIAAITMIVPTYIALTQNDARMLLAWHGIGQGGYMLLGVLVGTPMGAAGGLMHVFNYATYQAPLFLAVTAVVHRTGTADLDRLGGLITRMPLSYIAMLLGIIGLAGLPPLNGFVSKWLIYKSLLDAHMPLLFVAAVIGTIGTILSVYKLIHNIFLGQLRVEHQNIREAPPSMTLPMLAMAFIALLTGVMPGLVLGMVNMAQGALGFGHLPYHLGGFDWPTGSLDMLWVVGMMAYGMAIGALVFFLANPSFRTHQLDNYAGGHFLSADIRYHYSHNFYAGLLRVIGPWFRGSVLWAERGLVALADVLSSAAHGLYRAAYTPIYLLIGAVIGLWWVMML